ADNCLSARFVQDEQGMIFEYRSRSCVLTKTVMQIGDDEDIVVRQALEKKSLTCAYQQGFFNVNWLNTLTIDIDKCSGDLKDALEILLNR
ncbi:MAG: hypothetical protein Q7R96_05225, partial [Nanoarchaeota archaeon]|nr:hypothetical protein [Nanoarchaeota archaeon]